MSPKAVIIASLLVFLEVAAGLNLRAVEPPEEGEYLAFSPHLSGGRLLRRQSSVCPVGSQECAETATQVYCAPVCCFESGQFVYGCRTGYYCVGTGASAGCCPVGRTCSGPPPPCVNAGEAPSASATPCPLSAPVCTTNVQGAPVCSGTIGSGTATFTLTRTSSVTSTVEITTTSEETTTSSEATATATTSNGPATETATYTVTLTTTSESTSTEEPTTTEESTTTTELTTSFTLPTSNATFTPPPQATSDANRISAMNLALGLCGVAITFFSL
ncbi:hypothetical protein H072_1250 [Dactylellina haptotyla CBS 200.50]|uniref:Uncharacterized protein n=1 Tax=Dactylellina haptotyla (strain CBS 200.50) TaxID=1284197 RepID=S8APD1_DACHA|nr:hypothetical protein H072_1250 [Dactylellina haptotyla CBS 200.50]